MSGPNLIAVKVGKEYPHPDRFLPEPAKDSPSILARAARAAEAYLIMGKEDEPEPAQKQTRMVRYVPVVGPRLRKLLLVVFGLFALLAVNSIYLATVSVSQWAIGETYENYFYQWMFLGHLVLGLLIVVPVVVFGACHIRNAYTRPNRRAVRAGLALFTTSLIVLATGILLMRSFVDLKNANVRAVLYWLHVIGPVAVVWLFVLHRLAGRRIRWQVGLTWAAVAGVFALAMMLMHTQDPRAWTVVGPESGERYFFPSLSRTATGNFIPARTLLNDAYCRQ